MKPKQRDTQAQSSRMWLRHHDHREAIFDPGNGLAYHYAMYVNKAPKYDKQGHIKEEGINDYVWIKTPHNYILLHGTVNSIARLNFGWMDIDREFQTITPSDTGSGIWTPFKNKSGQKEHMNTASGVNNKNDVERFMHIGNHIIACLAESDAAVTGLSYQYTDNGVIWKSVVLKNPLGNNITQARGRRRPFGSNGWLTGDYFAGTSDYETGYQHLNGIVILNNETFSAINITINLTDIANSRYTYCCPTQTGCIIRVTTQTTVQVEGRYEYMYDFRYYHVTVDGNYSLVSTVENAYGLVSFCSDYSISDGNFGTLSYVSHGNTSGFLHFVYLTQYDESTGQNRYYWFFIAHMTTNNGVTWKAHTLLSGSVLGGYSGRPDAKGHLFFAQGKFYAMVSTSDHTYDYRAYEVRLYSSLTGDSWEEIPLPKWLDIPLISENAGLGVNQNSADKLRVAIIPEETSDADCIMHELYGSDIVRFKDGEIDMTNELFGVYLTDGVHNAYLNNPQLAENSKSFAWISGGTTVADDYGTYADNVQRYDYCVPAGGFDGQTPDPDLEYVYYIWDDVNNKFVGVDRHLSTYEHYPIIYVEVLPPTGVVMVLYGVKTDINQNPVYDYFIYENDEFVQIKNIESYPRYTVVTVSQLPMTGQANIIYAVARDMNSFSSYMYIWNPDAVHYEEDPETGQIIEVHGAFEDINTTEYPMTGKSFITVNVKKLPNKGKEGIIYVSETKITETVATDVETKYNYYRWLKLEGKYELITPVMSHNNIYVMTIHNLEPPTTTIDTDLITFRILKSEDTGMGKTMYSSEEDVRKYLERRTDKWDQWLNSKDDLPFVGSNGIFYIIKDEPVLNTGSYTLYIWDDLNLKYKESEKYEYYIPQSGQPEPAGLMKLVMDVGTAVINNQGEE